MATSSQTQTQLSAATALVQLLQEQEHLGLPRLAWRISDVESLSDTLNGSGARGCDPRPVIEAWAEVLGGEVRRTLFMYEGVQHLEFRVDADWRDVPVRIVLSCPAAALDGAVAA